MSRALPQRMAGDSQDRLRPAARRCKLASCCNRWRVERYMQGVFALSAAAMFVPVIFHTTRVSETDSLNKDAPGMTRWR